MPRSAAGTWWSTTISAHSVRGLYAAGDVAGVVGAAAAPLQGRIAARLGRMQPRSRCRGSKASASAIALARFGRAMTRVAQFDDDVIAAIPAGVTMCPCERLTRATLEAAIDDGCATINDLKSATRCGMGPCGGRVCEDSVARLIALKDFANTRRNRTGDRAIAATADRARRYRRRVRLRHAGNARRPRHCEKLRSRRHWRRPFIGATRWRFVRANAACARRCSSATSRARALPALNAGTLSLQIKRVGLMPYALIGHEWWRRAGEAIGFKQTGGYTLAFNQREQAMLEQPHDAKTRGPAHQSSS